jgi:D-sedoheptulose 7-phosphate isomerase
LEDELKTFVQELEQHCEMMNSLSSCNEAIEKAAGLLLDTIKHGGKILLCGNGGSAADCQHIAAEFVVRYVNNRKALAAIALTTDSSILTAHSNDFGFETVFSRQVEALGNEMDCLIAISTSGNSPNIIQAIKAAEAKAMRIVVLTGCEGGRLAKMVNDAVIVPSMVTARIQEAHILIGHFWCNLIEEYFSASNNT